MAGKFKFSKISANGKSSQTIVWKFLLLSRIYRQSRNVKEKKLLFTGVIHMIIQRPGNREHRTTVPFTQKYFTFCDAFI